MWNGTLVIIKDYLAMTDHQRRAKSQRLLLVFSPTPWRYHFDHQGAEDECRKAYRQPFVLLLKTL
uniref:Uncharacterized protein n=1 Tax=Anguilla anguilla TaxID=7936 RepID=A0A0E9Q3V2_ANGAN